MYCSLSSNEWCGGIINLWFLMGYINWSVWSKCICISFLPSITYREPWCWLKQTLAHFHEKVSAFPVFTWAGNPNKPTVGPTTRPGIHQEQWCNLWRSSFRYYLCAHLTFGDQLREWQARHSRPLFEAETRTLMTRRALVSLLAASFIEVWRVLILFCSGRLA